MRREIQAYFVSPIAYAFIAVFLLVSGVGFFYGMQVYRMIGAASAAEHAVTLRTHLVAGPFGFVTWVHIAMGISLPGLSMRLISEERKAGTIELLMTSPVSTVQLVLGKYLGTLAVYLMILAMTLPCVGILVWKGRPESAALAVTYCGIFLYGSVLIAMGLFASTLTESQFVALIVAYALFLPFALLDRVVGFAGPTLDPLLAGISIGVGLRYSARGLLDSHYVLMYGVLVFAFLFLSTRVLDSGRWR
jgi:ABC-2 type transport system permease protein